MNAADPILRITQLLYSSASLRLPLYNVIEIPGRGWGHWFFQDRNSGEDRHDGITSNMLSPST